MTAITALLDRANALAQDLGAALSAGGGNEAARQALARYSHDIPRHVIEDFAGDGSAWTFTFTGPFVVHQSAIVQVEYPVGERPPCYLPLNEWDVYLEANGEVKLILPALTPASGKTLRVTHTALHTIDELDGAEATTIHAQHLHGVVALTCSVMLRQAANRMTQELEAPLFQGDVRERGDKARSAAARADELEALYKQVVGVTDGPAPAMVQVDWDTTFAGSGVDHLTHRSKWR